jgi:hypothetical protein
MYTAVSITGCTGCSSECKLPSPSSYFENFIFGKSVEKIQVSLKFGRNNAYFT